MEALKILILIFCVGALFGACPDNCKCETYPAGDVVFCAPTSQEQLQAQMKNLSGKTAELHIGNYDNMKCNLAEELLDDTFQYVASQVLVNVYIESCQIKTVKPKAFSGLRKAQELTIRDNPIEKLPDALLTGLTNLAAFVVRNCQLATLDSTVFTSAPLFKRLEISGTAITDLNSAFSSLKSLSNLNVSHNNLAQINKGMFETAKKIATLDISHNQGVQIAGLALNDLTMLDTLHMDGITTDGNALSGDILSGLTGLNQVYLANNGFKSMTEIENFLRDVKEHIVFLDASDNNFEGLNNEELVNLKELDALYVSNCGIRIIEKDALRGVAKLTKLKIDHNSVLSIPDDFFIYSHQVTNFDISYNGLNGITASSFKHLTKLNELALAGSSLATIDDVMFPNNLETVTTLDLSNSSIATISDDAFISLTGLKSLNLNNNLLEKLSKNVLKNLGDRGVDVDISENNYDCNCEMFLYREWMIESGLNYSMICAKPEQLKGSDVMKLPEKETFGCSNPALKECCDVNRTVTEGESVMFQCTVEKGDPKPTLSLNVVSGDPLPANSTDFSSDNSTIVIDNLTPANSGNFTCTATNIWGTETTNYQLVVLASPTTTELTTLEPNTTTPVIPSNTTTSFPSTTPSEPGTGTPLPPGFSTMSPTAHPSHGPSGAVIGVIIVLLLVVLAVGATLLALFIKKRREAADRDALVASHPSLQV